MFVSWFNVLNPKNHAHHLGIRVLDFSNTHASLSLELFTSSVQLTPDLIHNSHKLLYHHRIKKYFSNRNPALLHGSRDFASDGHQPNHTQLKSNSFHVSLSSNKSKILYNQPLTHQSISFNHTRKEDSINKRFYAVITEAGIVNPYNPSEIEDELKNTFFLKRKVSTYIRAYRLATVVAQLHRDLTSQAQNRNEASEGSEKSPYASYASTSASVQELRHELSEEAKRIFAQYTIAYREGDLSILKDVVTPVLYMKLKKEIDTRDGILLPSSSSSKSVKSKEKHQKSKQDVSPHIKDCLDQIQVTEANLVHGVSFRVGTTQKNKARFIQLTFEVFSKQAYPPDKHQTKPSDNDRNTSTTETNHHQSDIDDNYESSQWKEHPQLYLHRDFIVLERCSQAPGDAALISRWRYVGAVK